MEKSLYFKYVEKFFPGLVLKIVEKTNGSSKTPSYLYRELLTKSFSADGRWASVLAEYSRVAADVVALDSELPLKTRDSIEAVTGDIPKIGMKLALREKQIKAIDSMLTQNLPLETVVSKMFADLPRCIDGVYERIEDMFLSEMSTGVGLSERNNGTGVRIDVGYNPANQFGVAVKWAESPTTATPIADIQKIFDKAEEDGNVITAVSLDDYAIRALSKCTEMKQQYAFDQNFVGTNIPNLSFAQIRSVFESQWGVTTRRIARGIRTELNGQRGRHNPWAKGRLVFTCDEKIGKLVWTTLAETTRPLPNVVYQIADEFILASRYATNDPFKEVTSSQAMVVPIIDNVDRIYTLDPETVQG